MIRDPDIFPPSSILIRENRKLDLAAAAAAEGTADGKGDSLGAGRPTEVEFRYLL